MIRSITLMRGAAGSGKSFRAKKLVEEFGGIILSTDDYWMRPDNTTYDFNPTLLGKAHNWNQQRFQQEVDKRTNHIIVDNTNITWKECKPYAQYAVENGYTLRVVEPDTEWKFNVEECFQRNTHRVPQPVIQAMLDKWQTTEHILEQIACL